MLGVLCALAANGDAEWRIDMVICRRLKCEYSWNGRMTLRSSNARYSAEPGIALSSAR